PGPPRPQHLLLRRDRHRAARRAGGGEGPGGLPLCAVRRTASRHGSSTIAVPSLVLTSAPAARARRATRSASSPLGRTTSNELRPLEPSGGGNPPALSQVLRPMWWW